MTSLLHNTAKSLAAHLGLLTVTMLLAATASAGGGTAAGTGLPPYPGATNKQFSGTLQANQVPLDALVLSTPDDMEKVLAFYRKQVKNIQEKLVEKRLNPSLAYVGYYDEPAGLMRLATVMKLADSGTLVILSAMDPRPLFGPVSVPNYVPMPAGARQAVTSGGEESNSRFLTVSYLLDSLTPLQARQLVVQDAERRGWRVEQQGLKRSEGMLTLSRGQRVCTVQFVQMEADNGSALRVSLVIFETKGKNKEKTP